MSRRLSPDEQRLWAKIAATAKPLKGKQAPAAPVARTATDLASRPDPAASPAPAKTPAKRRAPHPVLNGRLADPPAPPVLAEISGDKRVRRGRVEVDARIDLHGHTQMQARGALKGFLVHLRERGGRVGLVITGKGDPRLRAYGHDAPGVLRRMLPEWLSEPDLRAMVSGYASAHPRHGGAGAYYVFVKRRD